MEVSTECLICLDGPRTVVILPCMHLCLCKNCSSKGPNVRECPICRVAVENVMNIVPT